MKHSILLFLCISLLFSGCSREGPIENQESISTETPFDFDVDGNEGVQYAYGFGLVSPESGSLMVYEGAAIQAEYYIDNYGSALRTGLLIFVNGHLQTYSVAGQKTTHMHIEEVPAEEKVTVSFSFTPVTGKAGDILDVRFLSILNPDTRPNSLKYIFGNTNKMTTFFPRQIEMRCDAPEQHTGYLQLGTQRNMTEDEIKQVIYVDSKGAAINKLNYFHLIVRNANDSGLPYLSVEDNNVVFELQCYGGQATEYTLIPFVNQVPVLTDEYPCIVNVEEGTKIFEGSYAINLSDLDNDTYSIGQYNTFYMLAIPAKGSTSIWPEISNSYVFAGE